MIVYGILIGLTVFVYLFFTALHYEKNKVDKITITFFFIGYLLLLCLKDYSVGVDTRGYIRTFEYTKNLGWKAALLYGCLLYTSGFWQGEGSTLFVMNLSCFAIVKEELIG